ncbi:MAG: DNA polymerase III subunit alpha, partial [Bacilli bacterium]|nr:DNA polymerase III subunit alpha [Bacilli bacterium]
LESEGMNRAIREVKPTTFEDIVAILALYRPGPMQNIPAYGRRKAGHEKVSYLLPEWKPILESTYGIIVYQEQIMQIVRVTAGFSYAQADMFRRAISKKDAQKLASLKPGFIEGCIAHGHTKEIGEQAYDLIERFADYGFNKSHALCYAILSCQMAYLKCHYPLCFYGAVLDHGGGGPKKVGRLISEIRRRKIRFLVPSINEAENRFVLTKNGLMYPLSGIKDVNGPMVSAILNERMVDGPFEDIFDFAVRLKSKNLKVTDLVRLINAGCFDGEPASRASLRLTAPLAISYAEVKVGNGGQMLLLDFALPKPSYAEASADPLLDLELEREALGAMVSGSPLIGK